MNWKRLIDKAEKAGACEEAVKDLRRCKGLSGAVNKMKRTPEYTIWALNNRLLSAGDAVELGLVNIAAGEIDEITSGIWVCVDKCHITTVSGGSVWTQNNNTMTIETVSGGSVIAWDNSTMTIETVSGGYVRAWDNSTIPINTVSGGKVWAYNNSTINIETVSEGEVNAWDNSTMNITNDKSITKKE